jgi:hypothetical protein
VARRRWVITHELPVSDAAERSMCQIATMTDVSVGDDRSLMYGIQRGTLMSVPKYRTGRLR